MRGFSLGRRTKPARAVAGRCVMSALSCFLRLGGREPPHGASLRAGERGEDKRGRGVRGGGRKMETRLGFARSAGGCGVRDGGAAEGE